MPETDHSNDREITSPETVFDRTDIFVPTINRSTNGPDFRIDTDAECLTGRSIEAVRDLLESVLRKWDGLIEPESEAWHATKARSGTLPDDIHSFNGALRIPNDRIVWDDGEVSRESSGWVYKGYLRDGSSAIGADSNETDEADETDADSDADTDPSDDAELDIDRGLDDTLARIEADQHDRSDEQVGEHMQDGHEPVEQPIDDEIEFGGGETGDGEATEWPPEDADMTLPEAIESAPDGATVYTDRCSGIGNGTLVGNDVTINTERRPGEGSETRTAAMAGFEAGFSDGDVDVGSGGSECEETDAEFIAREDGSIEGYSAAGVGFCFKPDGSFSFPTPDFSPPSVGEHTGEYHDAGVLLANPGPLFSGLSGARIPPQEALADPRPSRSLPKPSGVSTAPTTATYRTTTHSASPVRRTMRARARRRRRY